MTLKHALIVAAALAATFTVLPAQADETGLASMHDWVRIGRKVCYTEHTHYASSTGPREPPSVLRSMIGRNSLPSNTERLGPISSELTPGGSPAAAKRAAGRVQFRLARVSAADSNLVSENPKKRR